MTLVLSIILKSVKSYPKIYIDLGLVDFLSGLRRDVTEDEQVVVDTILQEIDFIAKKSEENFENSTSSFEVSFLAIFGIVINAALTTIQHYTKYHHPT